jgi:hypothetical protein
MNCKSFFIRVLLFLLALLIITIISAAMLSQPYKTDAHSYPTPTCDFTPTPEPRPCELCYTLWLPQILIDETGFIEWKIIP